MSLSDIQVRAYLQNDNTELNLSVDPSAKGFGRTYNENILRDAARELHNDKTIRIVRLRHNFISAEIVQMYCEALKINSTLKVLDLSFGFPEGSDHWYGGEGVPRCISEALQHNNSLVEFIMDGAKLKPQQMAIIFEGLKHNTSLRVLNVGSFDQKIEAELERRRLNDAKERESLKVCPTQNVTTKNEQNLTTLPPIDNLLQENVVLQKHVSEQHTIIFDLQKKISDIQQELLSMIHGSTYNGSIIKAVPPALQYPLITQSLTYKSAEFIVEENIKLQKTHEENNKQIINLQNELISLKDSIISKLTQQGYMTLSNNSFQPILSPPPAYAPSPMYTPMADTNSNFSLASLIGSNRNALVMPDNENIEKESMLKATK